MGRGRSGPRLRSWGSMTNMALSAWWNTQSHQFALPTRTRFRRWPAPSHEKPRLDQARLRGEGRTAVVENVDERPFADLQAEQVAQQDDEAGQGYALDRAQIDDEGAQIVAERRSRPEARRRFCLEPLAAARAHAAKQCHASHLGLDRRDLDPVVTLASKLSRLRNVGAQPWQRSARNSRRDVGWGCNGRFEPACGLAFGFGAAGPDGFCPFDGGTLELFGVFGGSPGLASNSATRAVSASICFVRPATTRSCASACANTSRIRLSLSSASRASRFIQG